MCVDRESVFEFNPFYVDGQVDFQHWVWTAGGIDVCYEVRGEFRRALELGGGEVVLHVPEVGEFSGEVGSGGEVGGAHGTLR